MWVNDILAGVCRVVYIIRDSSKHLFNLIYVTRKATRRIGP